MQTGGPAAYLAGREKPPPPWPSSTETCPVNGLAPTRSSLPSPFRSPASRSSTGPASGKTPGGPNVPSPKSLEDGHARPEQEGRGREVELAVAREVGCDDRVGAVDCPVVGVERNPPTPSPSSTVTKSSPKLANATSRLAVGVEVAGRDSGRQVAGSEKTRGRHEGAGAGAEEDAQLIRQPRRRQDVEVAVSVQVGRGDLPRVAADPVARRRAGRSRPRCRAERSCRPVSCSARRRRPCRHG